MAGTTVGITAGIMAGTTVGTTGMVIIAVVTEIMIFVQMIEEDVIGRDFEMAAEMLHVVEIMEETAN